ncbi:hypothetical protein PM082_016369 [Marasmius tenuissimus]|nr:hypothetical protein PM082_016369 [Marasmius tenuissimus]
MLTLAALCVTAYLVSRYWTRAKHAALPPGPPSKPLIGNILKIPREDPWIALTEMKEKHGDVIFFHGLGNKVLVLNSLPAINDLLFKRSGVYACRPIFTVAGELMGVDHSMVFMQYGKKWQEHRSLAHIALGPSAVKKYHNVQEDIAILMCQGILEKPHDFHSIVRL